MKHNSPMAYLSITVYTEIKWGYTHTYPYIEKESENNYQNLFFASEQYFCLWL